MVTTGTTRLCGCGKEVDKAAGRYCICECHNTGLTYDQLRAARTTVYTYPWGTVQAIRYDHLYNLLANSRDVDGGISLRIEFSDGCSCGGPKMTPKELPAYLAHLEAVTPKIVAAIEKRKAYFDKIRPLQDRASIQADIMFQAVGPSQESITAVEER